MLLNRREAGRLLARKLAVEATRGDAVVLGLPRGGVPVAYEVARALGAPLDVFPVRRLTLASTGDEVLGVVAPGGIRVFDREALARHRVSRAELHKAAAREDVEVARRMRDYKGGRPCENVVDKTVVLVDDGASTGRTLRAAILALHERRPARIVVAVPTSPAGVCELLRQSVDAVHCLMTPAPFESIERGYEFFAPTTDGEVRELLAMAREKNPRHERLAEPGDSRPPGPRGPALGRL